MITHSQIKAGRALLNFTQEDLAKRAGVTQITVANLETGRSRGSESTLRRIQKALELAGVEFITGGVRLTDTIFQTIEGSDCFLRLLDDVYFSLKDSQKKAVIFTGCDERKNTPEVTETICRILRAGIKMRMIIEEGNDYILGDLDCYRQIPKKYFQNLVTVAYADKYAIVVYSLDVFRVHIINHPNVARAHRGMFEMLWSMGTKPTKSSASERYI